MPVSLLHLSKLSALRVRDNPWECPTQAVCNLGQENIFTELKRLAEGFMQVFFTILIFTS